MSGEEYDNEILERQRIQASPQWQNDYRFRTEAKCSYCGVPLSNFFQNVANAETRQNSALLVADAYSWHKPRCHDYQEAMAPITRSKRITNEINSLADRVIEIQRKINQLSDDRDTLIASILTLNAEEGARPLALTDEEYQKRRADKTTIVYYNTNRQGNRVPTKEVVTRKADDAIDRIFLRTPECAKAVNELLKSQTAPAAATATPAPTTTVPPRDEEPPLVVREDEGE